MVHEARVTIRRGRDRRRAFSLIEIMIALGILTIGLVMVAAVFPVALDQHRRSTDEVMARFSMRNAQAMLKANTRYTDELPNIPVANLVAGQRFYHPMPFATTNDGDPSNPLYRSYHLRMLSLVNVPVLPTGIIDVLRFDRMEGPPEWPSDPDHPFHLSWLDLIEPAPTAQSPLDVRSRRFWVGFYRKLNPTISEYVVFACKRNRGEWFASQDAQALTSSGAILARSSQYDAMLPIPWKLPMAVEPRNAETALNWTKTDYGDYVFRLPFDSRYTPQFTGIDKTNDLLLSQLVRPGSKLLSQTTGQVYTVVEVGDDSVDDDPMNYWFIKTLEDPLSEGPLTTVVNLWFVPGASKRSGSFVSFGKSPVVDVVRY